MRIAAIIPAKGHSTRLKDKNTLSVAGKPLFLWTVEAALGTEQINKVFVSTESEEVKRLCPPEAVILDRPECLTQDSVQVADVCLFALRQIEGTYGTYDVVIILAPTSPLRTSFHIRQAISIYKDYGHLGSVISCYTDPYYHWTYSETKPSQIEPILHTPGHRKGKQDFGEREWPLVENGAIYIVKAARFVETGNFRLPPFYPYIMPADDSIDVDFMEDKIRAEARLEGGKKNFSP